MRGTILPGCVVLFLAVAHAFAQEGERTDLQVLTHKVLPSDADERIDTFSGKGFAHHAWYCPSVVERPELVVFLPGTGGKGKGSEGFNRLAATLGFHLVSLAYPDSLSISRFHNRKDPDAMAKVRECILFGKGPFGPLKVNEANSIVSRLTSLLRYLADTFPDEHWEKFLDEKRSPKWEAIILSGQSQGGGHAAYLAKKQRVARVLMFGSPKDYDVRRKGPAHWYSGEGATPLDRFFSFVHSKDEGHGCTYAQQLENYHALKLMPRYAVVDVDREAPPFGHTRLLTSSAGRASPHTSVVSNEDYRPAWRYMLEAPVH